MDIRLPKEIKHFWRIRNGLLLIKTAHSDPEAEKLARLTADVCTIKGGSLSAVIPAECK